MLIPFLTKIYNLPRHQKKRVKEERRRGGGNKERNKDIANAKDKGGLFVQEWLCVCVCVTAPYEHTNSRRSTCVIIVSWQYVCVCFWQDEKWDISFLACHTELVTSRWADFACMLKCILEVYWIWLVCEQRILLFGGHKGTEGALAGGGGAGCGFFPSDFSKWWSVWMRMNNDKVRGGGWRSEPLNPEIIPHP